MFVTKQRKVPTGYHKESQDPPMQSIYFLVLGNCCLLKCEESDACVLGECRW